MAVAQGVISIGSVVGFLMLFNAFRFVTFISLFSFNMVQHGMASAGRILSVIKTTTDLDQNLSGLSRPIEGRVEFREVGFGYNGSQVLSGVSFVVEPGETVAIVGQTGSGKTTLTRLVNRIFDPDGGRGAGGPRGRPGLEPGEPALPDRGHRAGRVPVLADASGTTSPSAARESRRSGSRRPPARPRPTSSSPASPRATTRWWASAG